MQDAFRTLMARPELQAIKELPGALGAQARVCVVGGAVRDALLQVPLKDIDIVVSGVDADTLGEALEKLPGAKVHFVGATFPVFKVTLPNLPVLDIALARTERSTGGGSTKDFAVHAAPQVTIPDDLARRDFTVNAMAIDIAQGELIDPFQGYKDLQEKLIRAVGEAQERFEEDRTRILRGLRFALKLNFAIEHKTWEAMTQFAPRLNEKNDTGEYILKRELAGREFVLSVKANAPKALDLWDKAGALQELFPELAILKHIQQRPDYHPEGDVFTHTRQALVCVEKEDINVLLAVLLHDLGKATKFQVFDKLTKEQIPLTVSPQEFCAHSYSPRRHIIKNIDHERDSEVMARRLMNEYSFASVPGVDTDLICTVIKEHMFHGLRTWRLAKMEKVLFKEDGSPFWEMWHMVKADCCGSHGDMEYPELVKKYIDSLLALREEAAKTPPRLITGDDLVHVLRIKPGPKFKKILEDVREEQLRRLSQGDAWSKEGALEFARTCI